MADQDGSQDEPVLDDDEKEEAVLDDDVKADFETTTWEPDASRYGIVGLLRLREAMLPIEKPKEVEHLKFLICPSTGGEDGDRDLLPGGTAPGERDKSRAKAKPKDNTPKVPPGRYVPDMGQTVCVTDYVKGNWWRNWGDQDVLVRQEFSLASTEVHRVKPGEMVQQGGYMEVFVSGQAQGLKRMPVQPRGWVTVDATAVGGPKYLEPTTPQMWKVIFSSGSDRGDIVVREAVSLDSPEVGLLKTGAFVEQAGPQRSLEDGIIRLPISFQASSPSQPPRSKTGWVTLDARAQGGPMFFDKASKKEADRALSSPQKDKKKNDGYDSQRPARARDNDEGRNETSNSWTKNRLWKVCNLEDKKDKLAVVNSPEPFAPGVDRKGLLDTIFVRWLNDGDVVEQVGHSKKMRGHMVMPIRIHMGDGGNLIVEGQKADGWVTRRLVDKQKEVEHGVWFVELDSSTMDTREREERREARQKRSGEKD